MQAGGKLARDAQVASDAMVARDALVAREALHRCYIHMGQSVHFIARKQECI